MISNLEIVKSNAFAKFSYIPKKCINMKVREDNELLLINTDARSDMFNIAAIKSPLSRKGMSSLKKYLDNNLTAGVPVACWIYSPCVEIKEQINSLGLVLDESEIGMTLDFNNIKKPQHINDRVELVKVDSPELLHQWKGTIKQLVPTESLAMDKFFDAGQNIILDESSFLSHYLGLLDGTPVATSATFIDNGVVGIWDVITLPSCRGMGVGSTVTYKTIESTCGAGDIVSLSATDAGKSLYEKMGFSWCCDIEIYIFER